MKKILLFSFITIFIFQGCSYVNIKSKPSNNYYTVCMKNSIELEKPKIKILDTNYYKNQYLDEDNINKTVDFFNSIKKSDYIDNSIVKDKKPIFRMYIMLQEDSYIINIYDESYISVFPYDGDYEEDFINMNKVPKSLNLFYLCKNSINLDKSSD